MDIDVLTNLIKERKEFLESINKLTERHHTVMIAYSHEYGMDTSSTPYQLREYLKEKAIDYCKKKVQDIEAYIKERTL